MDNKLQVTLFGTQVTDPKTAALFKKCVPKLPDDLRFWIFNGMLECKKLDENSVSVKDPIFQSNHLLVLLDTSGSMASKDRLSLAKECVVELMQKAVTKDIRLEVITFSTEAALIYDSDMDKLEEGLKKVQSLKSDNWTNYEAALQLARCRIQATFGSYAESLKQTVLFLTDGEASSVNKDSNYLKSLVANIAKPFDDSKKAQIFELLGVALNVGGTGQKALDIICSENVIRISNSEDLKEVFKVVFDVSASEVWGRRALLNLDQFPGYQLLNDSRLNVNSLLSGKKHVFSFMNSTVSENAQLALSFDVLSPEKVEHQVSKYPWVNLSSNPEKSKDLETIILGQLLESAIIRKEFTIPELKKLAIEIKDVFTEKSMIDLIQNAITGAIDKDYINSSSNTRRGLDVPLKNQTTPTQVAVAHEWVDGMSTPTNPYTYLVALWTVAFELKLPDNLKSSVLDYQIQKVSKDKKGNEKEIQRYKDTKFVMKDIMKNLYTRGVELFAVAAQDWSDKEKTKAAFKIWRIYFAGVHEKNFIGVDPDQDCHLCYLFVLAKNAAVETAYVWNKEINEAIEKFDYEAPLKEEIKLTPFQQQAWQRKEEHDKKMLNVTCPEEKKLLNAQFEELEKFYVRQEEKINNQQKVNKELTRKYEEEAGKRKQAFQALMEKITDPEEQSFHRNQYEEREDFYRKQLAKALLK